MTNEEMVTEFKKYVDARLDALATKLKDENAQGVAELTRSANQLSEKTSSIDKHLEELASHIKRFETLTIFK